MNEKRYRKQKEETRENDENLVFIAIQDIHVKPRRSDRQATVTSNICETTKVENHPGDDERQEILEAYRRGWQCARIHAENMHIYLPLLR